MFGPDLLDTREKFDSILHKDAKGRVVFGVGLRATLYFLDAYTPEKRAGLVACVSDYLDQTAPHLRRCGLPDARSWSPFEPGVAQQLRTWVAEAHEDVPWDFTATGAATDSEALPFHVEVLASAAWQQRVHGDPSYLTATFPATWFTDRDERMAALLTKWAGRVSALHGTGGFSFYLPEGRSAQARSEKLVYGLARRFVGVDLDNPVTQVSTLGDRIKGVNWLTVLGDTLIQQVGGRDGLAARLPADARVHEYQGGVVVQLGEAAQIGDSAAGKVPASYAALSAVLRPLRAQPQTGWGVSDTSGYDLEGTRALLSRFDGAAAA